MNDLHDNYVSEERQWAQQSIKAAEGRGMTCFLWRCHLCWSLLTQLREWWIYDRYECSSSLIISFMEIMKNILSCLWWWSNFLYFRLWFSSLSSVSCFHWMQYHEFHSWPSEDEAAVCAIWMFFIWIWFTFFDYDTFLNCQLWKAIECL